MEKDLLPFKQVPFEELYFDPNNPRLAPQSPPGYDDPDGLFSDEVQKSLMEKIPQVYNTEDLRAAIESQGWVPIDAIVVWQHPKRKNHWVVLEGNTRTWVLRNIREELERDKSKLSKLPGAKKGTQRAAHEKELRDRVDRLQAIVNDTKHVMVAPVNASTIRELLHRLPRLLGVRHIQPARQWSPYAKNTYISGLYETEFVSKFPSKELALDPTVVATIAATVSQKNLETRRNIQAAHAFTHFKMTFDDRMPKGKGEGFTDEDQYFFDQIVRHSYAAEQFAFGKDDLRLSSEMEEVLFKWAFAKPRAGEGKNNILDKAEDIRLWHNMKMYDDKKLTAFAKRLNVEDPDNAPRIREIEAEFKYHEQKMSGADIFSRLLTEMSELKAEALKEQASHFRPILEEVLKRANTLLKMIHAVEPKRHDS